MTSASLRDLVHAARVRLVAAGIDANEATMDAALLARHVLGWDPARLIAHETDPPSGEFPPAFDRLVARRASREPISSIIGRREFRGLEFEVGPDVLAPRPETELIIDEALATLEGRPTRPGVGRAFPGLSEVEGRPAALPELPLDAAHLVVERLRAVGARADAKARVHARRAHPVNDLVAALDRREHVVPLALDVRPERVEPVREPGLLDHAFASRHVTRHRHAHAYRHD